MALRSAKGRESEDVNTIYLVSTRIHLNEDTHYDKNFDDYFFRDLTGFRVFEWLGSLCFCYTSRTIYDTWLTKCHDVTIHVSRVTDG